TRLLSVLTIRTVPNAVPLLPITLEAATARVWFSGLTKLISNADRIWLSGNCTTLVAENVSSATDGVVAIAKRAPATQAAIKFEFLLIALPPNMQYAPV